MSTDFGRACELEEGRKCEGRPMVRETREVCEEASQIGLPPFTTFPAAY